MSRLIRSAAFLGLAAVLIAVIDRVWRLRFWGNDDLAFAYVLNGGGLLPAQHDFYFSYRVLGGLLVQLQERFGPTAYGVFVVCLLALAMARWFAAVFAAGAGATSVPRRLAFLVVTGYVLAASFQEISFTGVALLTTFVGFSCATSATAGERSAWSGWGDVGLTLVGCAVRPQAGLLALALAILLGLFDGIDRRRISLQVGLLALVFVGFQVHDRVATDEAEGAYVERYAYTSSLLDLHSAREEADDFEDEVRLEFVRNWFLFDHDATEPAFLARHVRTAGELRWERLLAAPGRLRASAPQYLAHIGGWFWAVVAWMLLEALLARARRRAALVVAKTASVFATLLLAESFVGMKVHVFGTVLTLLALHLLIAGLPHGGRSRGRGALAVSTVLVLAGFVAQAIVHAGSRAEFDRRCSRTRAVTAVVEDVLAERVVLTMIDSWFEDLLVDNPPLGIRFPRRDVQILPLQGWITQFPDHRRAIDRLGGGAGARGLFAAIERAPEHFALVGGDRYVSMFREYAFVVFGRRLRVRKLEDRGLEYYLFVGGG